MSAFDQESEGKTGLRWGICKGNSSQSPPCVLPGSHTPSAESTAAWEHARGALRKSYKDFTSVSWGRSKETTLRLLSSLPSSIPKCLLVLKHEPGALLLVFHWVWLVCGPWLVCHPRPGWQSSPSSLTGAGLVPPAGTEVWAHWPFSHGDSRSRLSDAAQAHSTILVSMCLT